MANTASSEKRNRQTQKRHDRNVAVRSSVKTAVKKLREALEKGEFSDLRYKSAWVLGKIKSPRAVEPLCRTLLNDADHVVREWSAAALENCGDARAVPFLVLAMKRDSSKDVRLRAAVALRKLGAADAFRELLSSPEPETRGMAVTGLAKLACREAMGEVAVLVEDEDAEVRRRAAAYLGEFDVREAIDLLARALKDSEPTVRAEALKSLSRMKREQSCRMAQSALQDEDFGVRLAAVLLPALRKTVAMKVIWGGPLTGSRHRARFELEALT